MSTRPASLKLFCSYAHEDKELRDELEKHLKPLTREGVIAVWDDGDITGGREWDGEIKEQLNTADIILLLISPDFLASDYIHAVEVTQAMERHRAGTARVIPIILRPCDWKDSRFSKLQALPEYARPVTRWPDRDEAFLNVLEGIREVIDEFTAAPNRQPSHPAAAPKPPPLANIPRPPVFGFVARRDKDGRDIVERLKEELAPGRNQLVTLSGPGGIGKTTLAAEVARGLRQAYAGRIVWSGADSRSDFTLHTLLDDIATQLDRADIRQLAPDAKVGQVRALVDAPPALVVLDNYETIAPSVQKSIEAWFIDARCSALFTSRPRVAGTFPVQVSAMSREEAEEFLGLLIETTQAPSIFSEEVRWRIYETAEANPFVMQWVVAQIDTAQEPDAVLGDLRQGEGDAAQRVFDRSFNLPQLGDDGRAALLSLSLFVQSASRKALAEVAGFGDDRKRLDEAVKNMHALWLIKTVDENRRLTIGGLTRSLTTARLSKDVRAADFRRRFVDYFLDYAVTHSRPTAEDLNALDMEKDNLIGALDVASVKQDWESVIKIRFPLEEFFRLRGYWGEAVNTGEQALKAARAVQNELAVAGLALNLAVNYQNRGELTEARRLYNESLEISERLGDQGRIALTTWGLGNIALDQGDSDKAIELLQTSLDIFRSLGDEINTAGVLHQLGRRAEDAGAVEEARRLYAESLEIKKRLGDQRGLAITLHQLGRLAEDAGEIEEARRLYMESLEIGKRLGDQRGVASTLHQLGVLAEDAGEIEEARRLYAESLDIDKRLGNQSGIAISLHTLGRMAAAGGDKTEAMRLFGEAMSIWERLGSPHVEVARKDLEKIEGESS